MRYLTRNLSNIVASDITVYGELNPPQRRFRFAWEPREVTFRGWQEVYRAHLPEHPFARHYRGGGNGEAVRIADLLSMRQFRQLGIYEEFFRRLGVDREMIVWLPARRPVEVTVGVHRAGTAFSERDRGLLNLLRGHFIQSYKNAEAFTLLQRATAHQGDVTLLLGPNGCIDGPHEHAQNLLVRYFGRAPADRPPPVVAQWVAKQERFLRNVDDVPPVIEPLVSGRDGTRLTIRLLQGHAQRLLLLEERRTTRAEPRRLQALGLSPRETDVLAWVAEGKTNQEVGIILGLSPRTVAKHLERMYPRLGVENRTAAAARALELINGQSQS